MPIRAQRSTLPYHLHLLEKPQLVAGADEVVLGILDFVVRVAIEVVSEETHGLHEGEQGHGEGQMLALHRGEEGDRGLQIPSREGLEDVPTESDAVQIGRVFGLSISSRAEEVAVVREDVSGHHGV